MIVYFLIFSKAIYKKYVNITYMPNMYNWGKHEQAPHKWYIESNLLHSDGTVYVGTLF